MTAEGVAALVVAFATLLATLLGVYRELRQMHQLVNSRMTELLALTQKASHAEGVLASEAASAEKLAGSELPGEH